MKKLLLILLVLGTMSCNIMGYSTPKFTIGMTEQEFINLNKASQKVFADSTGLTIYRTLNGMQSYGFFAFDNGKLIRFEEGSNADDYKFIRL